MLFVTNPGHETEMTDASPGAGAVERRRNPDLRALIDDMLERVREIHRKSSVWNPEERAQAEAALEQIMARIRSRAASPSAGTSQPQALAEEDR